MEPTSGLPDRCRRTGGSGALTSVPSLSGYTNDLASPDPNSGRPHHDDRQALVRITPHPNLSPGPDLPSLSPGSLFIRVGPLRVLSKLNVCVCVCVCGQHLAQDKYAKTVVVVTIPFLF